MTWLRLLALAVAALTLAAPAHARIQPQMFCWVSDVEFPVGCTEDEEQDDEESIRVAGSDPWPLRMNFHHRRSPGA
jgi:hypothetical protein